MFLLGSLADFRAGVTPQITTFHVVFQREHNRIASKLSELNPSWNNDKLYEEARKINIAVYQHIVYKEYLPATIGNEAMSALGLEVKTDNIDPFFNGYNPNVLGGVTNDFNAAALRFGHSMISDKLE